ncbi:DUF421 domain-containing protein [Metabacillus sp. GX 13764]|uniref:DUF421 domain-containing protein n=1 Tax=Metabacillus kandeliae TaxID=2900151 RepID=UPI001E347BBE|nr:DUF421 domain-containing protein [Metabacillus kandeliae]MCD7035268.1 DUF421 domain-containing protein [Metabacillus kandeliae]
MEIIWESFVIFVFGYIFLRITGKKAVSQMHSFDLLFIIVISNVISQPVQKENVWMALGATVMFVVLYRLFMLFSLNNKLRWVMYESPTVLIRNGDIDRKGLRKVRIPVDELLAELRIKGYTDTKNIAIALLEDTGQISVIPKSDYRPVQPRDMKLQMKKEYIPIPVIMDGQILDHNLKYLKKDREWLLKKIKRKGEKVDEILLATITEAGDLSIDNNNAHDGGHDPYSYKPGEDN